MKRAVEGFGRLIYLHGCSWTGKEHVVGDNDAADRSRQEWIHVHYDTLFPSKDYCERTHTDRYSFSWMDWSWN